MKLSVMTISLITLSIQYRNAERHIFIAMLSVVMLIVVSLRVATPLFTHLGNKLECFTIPNVFHSSLMFADAAVRIT
jgi:hypothetical protein